MRYLEGQGGILDPDPADTEGFTPLLWAIRYDAEDAARYLYEAGASLKPVNSWGYNMLHMACYGAEASLLVPLPSSKHSYFRCSTP
jgi:hypothetical protein